MSDIVTLPRLSLVPMGMPHPAAAVSWVATSELDDPSPFLEGGEILLTTGLAVREPGGWERFVTQTVAAGVVAVGFGVGLSHPSVPAELASAAAHAGLNLFVVPRATPFIAVSRAVADRLTASEREADRQSLLHQQTLTTAALAAGGVTELLASLAVIVGGDALLVDADGSELAASPNCTSELAARALPHITRLHASAGRSAATEITRTSRMTVHPVRAGTHADAYLVVESSAPMQASGRTAIALAVALLTLDRARARAELDADRRIRAGALSLALQSDLAAAHSLLADTAESATLSAGRAAVVRARGAGPALDRAQHQLERDRASLDHPLVARINLEADKEQLVMVIRLSEDRLTRVRQIFSELEVGIGPARPLAAVADSDAGARQSLAAASAVRPVVEWSELAELGVSSLLDEATLDTFAHNLLDPVLGRPDEREILQALAAFLAHNGHVGPAAGSVQIHRNTLRNRLAMAEELFGRSLHDPQLRADLWVALGRVHAPMR